MATFTLAARNAQYAADCAKQLAEFARETGEMLPTRSAPGATAPGDWLKLRGIPAIGRGVQGVIRGTSPEDAVR